MLLKVLKFVIVSRFSKPILAFLAVLFVYFLLISPKISTATSSAYHYYGPIVILFALVYPVLSGGIGVLKSDRDFLFTLPIRRLDLAFALFIVQFLSFGFLVFYLYSYVSSYLQHLLPFALIDFIAITLAATSLGPISYTFKLHWRILISALLSIWLLSPYLGFQYAPSSVFTGSTLYPVISSLVLAIITVPLALRSLSRVDLDMMKTLTRFSSSEVRHARSFRGMTPLRAMFVQNFLDLEVSGRMNTIGAGASYRSGRIKLSVGMPIVVVVAIIYYFAFSLKVPSSSASIALLIITIYSTIVVLFFSTGVLGNERLWLGFMARGPVQYLRGITVMKSLSVAALLSPLAVADFLIAFRGVAEGLMSGITLLITIPSLLVLEVYLSAFVSPIQVKEELTMPSQFTLRQVVALAPVLVVWIFSGIAFAGAQHGLPSLFIAFSLIPPILMTAIAVYLLSSKKTGERLVEKLVGSGFV